MGGVVAPLGGSMGSDVSPWGVWLHVECGGSIESAVAPWGVCWLHGECACSMWSVVAPGGSIGCVVSVLLVMMMMACD